MGNELASNRNSVAMTREEMSENIQSQLSNDTTTTTATINNNNNDGYFGGRSDSASNSNNNNHNNNYSNNNNNHHHYHQHHLSSPASSISSSSSVNNNISKSPPPFSSHSSPSPSPSPSSTDIFPSLNQQQQQQQTTASSLLSQSLPSPSSSSSLLMMKRMSTRSSKPTTSASDEPFEVIMLSRLRHMVRDQDLHSKIYDSSASTDTHSGGSNITQTNTTINNYTNDSSSSSSTSVTPRSLSSQISSVGVGPHFPSAVQLSKKYSSVASSYLSPHDFSTAYANYSSGDSTRFRSLSNALKVAPHATMSTRRYHSEEIFDDDDTTRDAYDDDEYTDSLSNSEILKSFGRQNSMNYLDEADLTSENSSPGLEKVKRSKPLLMRNPIKALRKHKVRLEQIQEEKKRNRMSKQLQKQREIAKQETEHALAVRQDEAQTIDYWVSYQRALSHIGRNNIRREIRRLDPQNKYLTSRIRRHYEFEMQHQSKKKTRFKFFTKRTKNSELEDKRSALEKSISDIRQAKDLCLIYGLDLECLAPLVPDSDIKKIRKELMAVPECPIDMFADQDNRAPIKRLILRWINSVLLHYESIPDLESFDIEWTVITVRHIYYAILNQYRIPYPLSELTLFKNEPETESEQHYIHEMAVLILSIELFKDIYIERRAYEKITEYSAYGVAYSSVQENTQHLNEATTIIQSIPRNSYNVTRLSVRVNLSIRGQSSIKTRVEVSHIIESMNGIELLQAMIRLHMNRSFSWGEQNTYRIQSAIRSSLDMCSRFTSLLSSTVISASTLSHVETKRTSSETYILQSMIRMFRTHRVNTQAILNNVLSNIRLAMIQKNIQKQLHDIMCVEGSFRKTLRSLDRHSKCVATSRSQALIRSKRSNSTCLFSIERVVSLQALCRTHSTICDKVLMSHGALLQQAVVRLYVTRVEQISLLCHVGSHQAVVRKNCRNSHLENDSKCLLLIESVLSCSLVSKKLLCLYHAQILICNSSQCGLITADTLIQNTLVMKIQATARKFELGKRPGIERCTNIQCCIYTANTPSLSTMFRGTLCIQSLIRSSLVDKIHDAQCKLELLTATKRRWGAQNLLHGTQFNLSPLHCIIRLSALKWKSQLVEKDVKCLQGVLTSWRTKANEREYYVYTLPASIKSCIQRSQVTDDRQLMINVNTVISQILTVRENNTKFQKCSVISAILRRMNYQLNLDNDLIMIQSIARSLNFKIYEDVEAIKSIIRTKLLTSYEDFAHNISKLSSLIRRELNTSLIPKVLVLQISLRSNLFSCNNLAIIRALITISSCFRTSLRRGEGSVGDYLYSTIRSSQVNPPFSQAVGTQSVCRSHSSMLAPDSVRVAQCTARMALDRRILSSSDRVLCDTSAMIVTRGHLLGAFNTVSLIQSNIRRSVNTKKTCVIIQNIVRMALLHTSKLSSPWDLQAVISSRCVSVLSPVSCSIVQSMTRGGDLKISFKPTIAIQALFSLQGYAKISTTALSAELFSFEKRQQATLKKLDIIKLQARSRSIQGIEDCHNGIRQVQATIRSLLLNASYGPIKLQQLAQITTIQSGVISSSENNFDTEALRCCISRTHGGRQLSECYQAIIILEAAARWSFQAKRCEKISITALSASSFSWEKRYPTARKNIDITKIQAISRAIRDNYEDFCRVKASIQTSLLLHVSYEVSIQSLLRQQLVRINHDHCIQLSAVTRSSLGRSKDILPIRVMQGHIRASQHHISPNQIAMIQSRIRPTLKNNFDTETLRCCISRTRDSMQFSGCYRVIAILEAAVRINLEAEGCETIYVTTLNALSLANERIQQATLKMKDIMKIQAIFRSLQAIQNTCKEIFRVQATIRTSQSLNNSHETVAIDRVSQTSIQSLLRQQLLRFNPDHCIQLSTIIRSSLGRSKDTLLINIMQGHIRSNQWNLSPNQIAMIQSEIRFTQRYDFDTRILRFCMLRAHGGIQLSEYCRAITILETATRRRLKAKEYEAIHDTVLNGCEKSQKTRSKTKGVMKIQAIFRSITGILDNYEGICRVQAMIRPFQLLDMPHRTNSINHIPIQSCLLQCVSRFNSEYCIQLSTVIRGSLGRCKDTLSINIVQDFLRSYEHHLSLNQIVTIQSGIRSAAENNFDTEAHGGIQLSEYCRAITILEAATRGCRKTGGYGAIHVTVLNAITRGREKRQKTNEIMKIQALSRAIQDSQDNYEDICRVQATMCTSQSLNFNALVVDRISQIPIQSFLRQQLAKFNLDSCVQLSAIVRGSLARNKDALFIKVMQGLTRASQYHSSSGQTAVIQSRIRSILKNNFDTENLRCCISRTHGGVHLSEYCRAIAILEATTLGGLKADSTTPLVTSVCHIQSIVRCAQVGISPVIAYTAKMSSYLRSSSLHDTNSDILVHIMQSIVRTNLNSPKLKYSNLACEIQTSLQSSDLCQMQLHGQCLQNFIKNRSTNDYYEELKLVQSVLKQRYVNPKNTQNTSRIQALVRRDVNYMRVELISSLEAHLRYVLSEGSNLAYGIIPHLQAVIKANVIKGDHLSREQNLGIMKASIRPSHPHNHDLKAISDIEAVMSAVNDRSSLALGIVKLAPLSSFRPNDMNSFTTQMQESLSVIHSLIQSRNVDIIEHGRLGHLQAQFLQSKGGYKQEQLSIDKLSSCFVDVDAVREKQMEMRVVQKLASTCRRVGRQANSALQVNYVRKIQSICRRLNNLLNTNHLTVQASMRSSTQDLLKIIAPLSATIESTMITQPRIDFLQSLIRNSLAEQFVGNQNIATMQNICRTHEQEARLSGLTQCIHSLLLSRVLTYPSLVRCIQSIILTRESIIDFKELHLLVHLASSTLSYPSPVTPYCITNAALQCTNRREMIDEVVCCQAITRMALVPHNRDRDSIRPTPESSFQLLSKQLIIEGITLLKKYICEATKVLGRHLWQRYTITGYANNCNMTWHRSVQASSLVYSLRFHQSASAERK